MDFIKIVHEFSNVPRKKNIYIYPLPFEAVSRGQDPHFVQDNTSAAKDAVLVNGDQEWPRFRLARSAAYNAQLRAHHVIIFISVFVEFHPIVVQELVEHVERVPLLLLQHVGFQGILVGKHARPATETRATDENCGVHARGNQLYPAVYLGYVRAPIRVGRHRMDIYLWICAAKKGVRKKSRC